MQLGVDVLRRSDGAWMHIVRWSFTVIMSAAGFAVAWVLSDAADLDTQSAVAVATVAATLILTPLASFASKSAQPSQVPGTVQSEQIDGVSTLSPQAVEGSNPQSPRKHVVVGDIPLEAVAWQERTDLLDRLVVVAASGRPAVVCAVTGQRGIGKTQLAAAYARQRVADGWPVVAWVLADTELGVLTGLDQLAAAAGLRQPAADAATGAAAALAWLRDHAGPCLLIYDNAVDAELIRRFTPAVGAVQTVVTTTELQFANLGVTIDVSVFTEAQAVAYLRERTGLVDDCGARAVAEQLGRLPVALAQTGAVVCPGRRFPTYRSYLDRLDAVPVSELLRRQPGGSYPQGAAEAILISLDDLAGADIDGASRRLLNQLSVLAPSGVDATLLNHLVKPLDDNGPYAAEVVALLAQRSLTMPTLDHERTVVHRLIQRVVRDRTRQIGDLDRAIITVADALNAAADDASRRWQHRKRLSEYAEHVMALRQHPSTDTARTRVVEILGALLSMNNEAHNWTTSIAIGPTVIADQRSTLGPDHLDALVSRDDLARAYQEVGRLDEAITLHTQTLADRERVLGPDHPDTLLSRSGLATAYRAVGRLDEAITLHTQTLAARERVLGPDHPDTLVSQNNLAYSYRAVGRFDEAIAMYTRTLADRERVVGPNHPDTLLSRNGLAGAYRGVGRLVEAITLLIGTLADRERILGPDHPDTLLTRNNLAYSYLAIGRFDEAIALHARTVADRERVLGPDHPETLLSRLNLATAYRAVGRLDEASKLHTRTLRDYERVLGPSHPATLRARSNPGEHPSGEPW
jgi:tetratricopeptide (TPR) repeat protein